MNKRNIRRGLILTVMLVTFATSALAASYTTLRYRDEGSAVLTMQKALVQLGYSTGGTDGKFGPTTEKAVKQFQRENGLKADGLAGSQTLTLLYAMAGGSSATAKPTATPRPSTGGSADGVFGGDYATLRYGARGERVAILQKALNDLGFACGSADGKFGTGTQMAVVAFQQANNLEADGLAGRATLRKIESLLKGDTGGSSATAKPTATPKPDGGYVIPTRTLRRGYTGEDVRSVQKRLKELGYYTGSIDGEYGLGSMAAVQAFQERNGLSADGLAGASTNRVLFSTGARPATSATSAPTASPTPSPSPTPGSGYVIPTRTLRQGYTGEDVRSVQKRLKELGYYTGSIDGEYGLGSMAAVRAFQERNGLTADGLAGYATNRALFSTGAKPAATSAPTASPTPTPTPKPDTKYDVPDRVLSRGAVGDDVLTLQKRLKELGYYTSLVDGSFGDGTATALMAFQERNGLTADGVAGSSTYSVLFSSAAKEALPPQDDDGKDVPEDQPTASEPSGGWTTLKLNSTGDAVVQLQKALAQLNYPVGVSSTKTYDPATRWAVECFQRRNGLPADGVAGASTQAVLYGGKAVGADTTLSTTVVRGVAPGGADLELLHWFDDIKSYLRSNREFTVYDPATGLQWKMRLYSAGNHADSEPLTKEDSDAMYKAWGNQWSWNEKPVFVRLANGTWCLASMPNMPHLSGGIADNGFDGHTCVHFPRTMTEVQKNDPKNAGRHNRDIRLYWRVLTGEDIPW